ncbi:glycosyltransferase family 1 protein [Bremerella sp. JC770]|uniref:glycosyltransferase family 4 protein n=1 Tax=Bremerella sp. JC770 TaxID=3232137 RepID=UPI0034588878
MTAPTRRLLIDITHTASQDFDTGIQRVARSLARESLAYSAQKETQIESFPVVELDGQFVHVDPWCAARGYRKSQRSWTNLWQNIVPDSLGTSTKLKLNKIVTRIHKILYPRTLDRVTRKLIQRLRPKPVAANPGCGDIILMPDVWWDLPEKFETIHQVRQNGTLVGAIMHDLIPIRNPEFFGEEIRIKFTEWAERLIQSVDFVIAVSKATEDDLWQFIQQQNAPLHRAHVSHIRLGCDIKPTCRVADSSVSATIQDIFGQRDQAPYLMVSTIEIRKNHHYLLDAFELLWQQGHDVSLALVGRIGWQCDDLIERISHHAETGKRLHLLNNVDDDTLNYIYQHSKGFLFSSKAEGFGLPIVEAQHHGLHVFTSDIPLFREVAGSGARFFSLEDPSELQRQIIDFETNRGWETEPSITVQNEPWKDVFPKLVGVVEQLAANVQSAPTEGASKAA